MTAALPPTLAEWRRVLDAALAIPARRLRAPRQLLVCSRNTGGPITFGALSGGDTVAEAMERQAAARAAMAPGRAPFPSDGAIPTKPRHSGVMALLLPYDTVHPPLSSTPTPAPWEVTSDAGQPRSPVALPIAPDGVGSVPKATTYGPAAALNSPEAVPFTGMDLCIALTERTSKMRKHSGQMAFPGGRCDGDETPLEAAERETLEEVGVASFTYDSVGPLSPVFSFPSKTHVHPFVALGNRPVLPAIASEDEVAGVHYLRLSGLLLHPVRHHHRHGRDYGESFGGPLQMPAFYTTDGKLVWGLTAFAVAELVTRIATVLQLPLQLPTKVLEAYGDRCIVSSGQSMVSPSTIDPHVPLLDPLLPWSNPYDDATADAAGSTVSTRASKL